MWIVAVFCNRHDNVNVRKRRNDADRVIRKRTWDPSNEHVNIWKRCRTETASVAAGTRRNDAVINHFECLWQQAAEMMMMMMMIMMMMMMVVVVVVVVVAATSHACSNASRDLNGTPKASAAPVTGSRLMAPIQINQSLTNLWQLVWFGWMIRSTRSSRLGLLPYFAI